MVKKIVINLVVNMLALYIVVELISGITYSGGLVFFLIAALIIGLLNGILKPIMKLLSLPFIFITGGLFLIVINGLIFYLLDHLLLTLDLEGIDLVVTTKLDYVLAAIVFGLANWLEKFALKF